MPPVSAPGTAASFNDLRRLVYDSATATLPEYEGASDWETIQALFFHVVSERITRAMMRTLVDVGDFKEDAPKLFHPKGVCAEAAWEIDADSDYTGLFAKGASVPAIVRMSASGNNTQIAPELLRLFRPRSFGLAVKLFPSADRDRAVQTRNLLLFDHTGVDGNPSAWYMRGQDFVNTLNGDGPVTSGFARLFAKFASDVRHRSVEHLAAVDGANRKVGEPHPPRFVRLVPSATYPEKADWEDFRQELIELARLGPLAFDVFAGEAQPPETRLGRLTLGTPVASTFGDRRLHFSHRTA